MDRTKLRLYAGISGVMFSFAGVIALAIALVVVLSQYVGPAWSAVIIGAIFLMISGACFFAFLRPDQSADDEIENVKDVAADALADLPFDTAMAIIEKRPLTSTALAAAFGYSLMNSDDNLSKTMQRVLFGIL